MQCSWLCSIIAPWWWLQQMAETRRSSKTKHFVAVGNQTVCLRQQHGIFVTLSEKSYNYSMAIYVRGTYRQTQLFYWLIMGLQQHVSALFLGHHQVVSLPRLGYTTCSIAYSTLLTVSATHIYCHTDCISHNGDDAHKEKLPFLL